MKGTFQLAKCVMIKINVENIATLPHARVMGLSKSNSWFDIGVLSLKSITYLILLY